MNTVLTNMYREFYRIWMTELTDVQREYFDVPNADIESFIHLIPAIDSEEYLTEKGKQYLDFIKSLSPIEQLAEYCRNHFFYNIHQWTGSECLDTFIPEYSIRVDNSPFEHIQDFEEIPLLEFPYTDVLIIHKYFQEHTLPKTNMGVYYFDSCNVLFDFLINVLQDIKEGKSKRILMCGESGVGKKHFTEVILHYCEQLELSEIPTIDFMTISASELRLHKKLNSDSSTYVVYVPSVVELLDQNGVYNNGNLPLPYIMTISKAVDIQLEYETMFWGKSIDAITQRLKLISRKKQLWSICLYGTNNFSGIANKKEIADLEDTGFENYLVRSNSRWTHNYNDLWRYIMASLRFGDWDYHNAYHNVPDGFITDYTDVYEAILKVPEFKEKQIDKERHEATIKKFYSFADKYDERLTVLMLRVRAKGASSKLRSELIDGRLDANRLDRIWLDIRKAMKVYGVRYGLYNNETKILHAIIKKFEISLS